MASNSLHWILRGPVIRYWRGLYQSSKRSVDRKALIACSLGVAAFAKSCDSSFCRGDVRCEQQFRPKISWERTSNYLRGLKHMDCGIDIGGTTAKFAVLQRDQNDSHVTSEEDFGVSGHRAIDLEVPCPKLGGKLHFIKWFTENTGEAMSAMRDTTGVCSNIVAIHATGGGAHRFADICEKVLGTKFFKVGEFDSLIEGLRFIIENLPESIYCIQSDGTHIAANFCDQCFKGGRFPVLVCNIGTGVSMIKVASNECERVGGTSIGGSTFLGLVYQLTSARTFDEAMHLAQTGDASEVDLLVKDIYGESAEKTLGIPGDITASSFGRLTRRRIDDAAPSEAALATSTCILVTQAIALYACQLARRHGCREVIFTGGFLEGNELAKKQLSYFISQEFKRCEGDGRALFLRHSEYAGALGCLSRHLESKCATTTPSSQRRLNH